MLRRVRREGAYGSALSVSHDSVFTGERSGDESGDERPAHLSASHRAELVAAARRRGRGDASDDDEDLGLPRSPPASPPTDKADKRHHAGISQSSCSDGSLLSVGSSEMDEDSSSGHHHSHDHSARSDHSDMYSSSEPPSGVAPLSHSAARHKMAVRPRRTHGAPRRNRNNPIAASALPITPELNEEMIRSTTPEVVQKTSEVVTESFSSSTSTKHHVIVEGHHQQLNRELQRVLETPVDTKLKSSSLPPGLALSQLAGRSPAKLSIAESDTPRSSIKRSKSSSQEQSLRDGSPTIHVSTGETGRYQEERVTKTRAEKADEPCLEKKSKSDKKMENDVIKAKKEESFFSRLLLRKSGKKSKKDQTDSESQYDAKKSKTEKSTQHYKAVDAERSGLSYESQGYRPVPAERTHKSAGQKAFANQMHKRIDNKGAYVQEGVYKDVYSTAKVSNEYSISDLKFAEETDKMLNLEMKNRFCRREDFSEKTERSRRSTSKEAINESKKEPFDLHPDRSKRFSSKAFVSKETIVRAQEENLSPTLVTSDEEPPPRNIRKPSHNDFMFHSGSMPSNIPYFNPSLTVSASASHSKTVLHQSSESVKRSSEHVSEYREKREIESKREKIPHVVKTEESYVTSGLRSLGDEYVETRSSIGKSHSFRYSSETTSVSSQESQMPSLPAIVGISEPLLESWEVNYRRNVNDRQDYNKRVSARNYNIIQGNAEPNYDSLPSTDSSYLDSLKAETAEERKLFTNSIQITMDTHKRDSDISQIEAKIDDIISSPKPIMAPILKSSSLDSVKSSPEKPMDDRRKTISVESALSHSGKVVNNVSVTHINKEQTPAKTADNTKLNKNDDKADAKSGVPEFLKIQLNRVDAKPITNIVLTANLTPKKTDSPQVEMEEIQCLEVTETKSTHNIQIKPEANSQQPVTHKVPEVFEVTQKEDKSSPLNFRKSIQSITPQSPSTPKTFFKRKSTSVESQDKPDKPRTNSLSTEGSTEKIYDNISLDQKSHSSFGSKSSIQSSDSNECKPADKQEETVVYRKKPVAIARELRGDKKNDDEPELMKVFARRSLKLKDSEADSLAREIAENNKTSEGTIEQVAAARTKVLKNEFNASIKSRDSDKENEDTVFKEQNRENKMVDIAARVSQFGAPHYQRSVSITSMAHTKRDSAPVYRSDVNRYKKEVSDSTPEKRLRNRTFPDPSNDRDDIKSLADGDALGYRADTLTKRPWQRKDEDRVRQMSVDLERTVSVLTQKDSDKEKDESGNEKGADGEADASPQFKGILQMRAEWERRAKQGMTK